jgi:hypothetical protein
MRSPSAALDAQYFVLAGHPNRRGFDPMQRAVIDTVRTDGHPSRARLRSGAAERCYDPGACVTLPPPIARAKSPGDGSFEFHRGAGASAPGRDRPPTYSGGGRSDARGSPRNPSGRSVRPETARTPFGRNAVEGKTGERRPFECPGGCVARQDRLASCSRDRLRCASTPFAERCTRSRPATRRTARRAPVGRHHPARKPGESSSLHSPSASRC